MKNILDFIHHLFIPKEENNFRAKALHSDFLSFYLILALLLTFSLKQFNLTNVLGFATDISVNKLLELTNNERAKNNLPPLTYNDKLAQAATLKAQDMFTLNYWAHYAPNGTTPWDFILKAGYQYEYAGENLAKNFLFSQGVVDSWMNSPTHRNNILKNDYSDVGFAVINGTLNNEPTTLVVQMFGKPSGANPIVSSFTPPTVQAEEKKPKQPLVTPSLPQVLAKDTQSNKFTITNLTLNMNFIFMLFLLIALGLDFYFATKLRVIRIGGKNVAHFIFILFIFAGLIIFTKGAIL